MLTLLLIIALTNFKIISGVEDNNKFINSLPAKQKEEFLQKVEKRIQNEVPEVKSPEANDTNVDQYEKRLEDQSKSIQNIMRSEIEHIKSQQLRSTNDTVNQRRNTNETARQSAHIDLTFRAEPYSAKTETRRRETEGHTNKIILYENIPVAVHYEKENVGNGKSSLNINNELKSDAKTVGINNTSAERKRTGRRSNAFEFDNVTLANPDVSPNTDAVRNTTTVKIITHVQDMVTTKKVVDFHVTSERPTTQEIAYETTKQEVSIQADDKKSRTAQGNINTTTDSIKLDYSSSTQNNAVVSSTSDSPEFNDNDSSLTLKSIHAISDDLVISTSPHGENPQTGDTFNNTIQYYVNPHSHSVDISTSQYNLNNSTVGSVLTTTATVDRNKIINNTDVTLNMFDSSTILNNVTTTTYKVYSNSNKTTKIYYLNETKDKSIVSTNIHNFSAVVDDKHPSTTHNKFNNTYNLPSRTEPGAVDRVMYKDHNETTQGNVNDIADNQSAITKLGNLLHVNSLNNHANTNVLRSKSKLNVKKHKQNITAYNNNAKTTTIGIFNNDHHIISGGVKNLVDVDAESRVSYDITTLVNVIKTKDNRKESNKTVNVKLSNNNILIGLDGVETESLYKTTRNVSGDAHTSRNNHKYTKTTKELNNTSLSHTPSKEPDRKQSRNTNITYFGFSLHVPDPNNTISDSENHPKYVPVYNYDPENAYFNPNTGRPWNDDVIEKNLENSDPVFIKKTETRSDTTKLDIYANGNKKSLRIKDIKERVISASNTKIKANSNLYDIISGDDSVESSNEDVLNEKPLKHSLKKIREKIYKHQINNKPKDQSNAENKYKDEVRKKYSAISDKNEEKSIADIFSNFGALLQKLAHHADRNEVSRQTTFNEDIPSDNKKDSNEDVRDSDRDIYRNVAHSLDTHNKFIKNKGIQQIVEELEKIQNNLHKKRKKKIGKHGYQSRFQVKDRDENKKHVEDKIYRYLDNFDKPLITDEDEIEFANVQLEKSKAMKIEDDYLDLHANILKDLVNANDEGLQKYDWLGTTVLIQAGLAKLLDITERKIHEEELHPLDLELLEFAMKLHKDASQLVAEQENKRSTPTKRKRLSFRIPKAKKGRNFNALNRMYGEINKARAISLIRSGYSVEDFREFLVCMRSCLNDLHTAIRQISFITTYKKQRWFKNLKQLYLNEAREREYLELLLHFVTARLIGLIDERVKKVFREEGDFTASDREADRIEVEFVMTLKICKELSRLND